MINESREETSIWLERKLVPHNLVIYIDASFVSTRCDKSLSKEAYSFILSDKENGTREVLSNVNHPTEGAGLWENEFKK